MKDEAQAIEPDKEFAVSNLKRVAESLILFAVLYTQITVTVGFVN